MFNQFVTYTHRGQDLTVNLASVVYAVVNRPGGGSALHMDSQGRVWQVDEEFESSYFLPAIDFAGRSVFINSDYIETCGRTADDGTRFLFKGGKGFDVVDDYWRRPEALVIDDPFPAPGWLREVWYGTGAKNTFPGLDELVREGYMDAPSAPNAPEWDLEHLFARLKEIGQYTIDYDENYTWDEGRHSGPTYFVTIRGMRVPSHFSSLGGAIHVALTMYDKKRIR